MNTLLELEEAQEQILAVMPRLSEERVALAQATGGVLAEDVIANIDLPLFDNSAMDGYAVQAQDIAGATGNQPVPLRLIGHVRAGQVCSETVVPGTCVRVFTGSPLPKGADAVVMQEDTRTEATNPDTILFLDSIKPWENIRFTGEDVRRGNILLAAGQRVSSAQIGLLAAMGRKEIVVTRRPIIGLIATGDELQEPGEPLAAGHIYESNRAGLSPLVLQAGAEPRIFPLVPDDIAVTEAMLGQALQSCDAVITSGGVSVGEFDCVKSAFERLGGQLAFWKVAIKPGKPFVFGQWEKKFLFGLPGNPISAVVTFLLLVRPALLRLQGANRVHLNSHPGTLSESLVNRGDRRHFMRVHVDQGGQVRSAGIQASHILASLARSNGLVDVRPHATLAAGETVSVLRWELD